METQSTEARLASSFHWYHWLIVVGSLVLTFSAWYVTSNQAQEKMQAKFEYQANQVVQLVKERMEKYEEALWAGVAALHTMKDRPDRDDWHTFASRLKIGERFPGINGIGVIHFVGDRDLENYLHWQREIAPNFYIHPQHGEGEYWPISYIEPEDINRAAIGLDMAHEKNRYYAAQKARDTGVATITAPITLVQDAKKTPGFLFFAPWYLGESEDIASINIEEDFIGLVYAPFIVTNLMDGTLANTNRLVNFRIFDGDEILYDELEVDNADKNIDAQFFKRYTISMYGRQWRFDVYSSALFSEQESDSQPLLILVGGIIIDILLFTLITVLVRANRLANEKALKLNRDLKSQQVDLEIAHGKLSGATNAMLDGFMVMNRDGIISQVNDAAVAMFGYPRDALLGADVERIIPAALDEFNVSELIAEAKYTQNQGSERMLHGVNAEGHSFPVKLSITNAVHNGDVFLTGVVHDLSVLNRLQKNFERTEGLFRAAMYSAGSGYIVTDTQACVIDVNTAFCDWVGIPSNNLVEHTLAACIAPADQAVIADLYQALRSGRQVTHSADVQFVSRHGDMLWGHTTFTGVRDKDGKTDSVVVQIVSLVEQKSLEEHLHVQNQQLEEANNELNQFAFIASHDLKEPLRTMRTFTSYLVKDVELQKWERVTEDVQHIESASKRMTNLITSLLDLSRAGNKPLKTEKFLLADGLSDVLLNLQGQIEESGAGVKFEHCDCAIIADRQLLMQALQNLISNALKFHADDVTPTVVISAKVLDRPQRTRLTIADNGLGIHAEDREKIFLAFTRLHGIAEYEGTGIGLSVVKKIIDRHRGDIRVFSNENNGSTFEITLPHESQSMQVDTATIAIASSRGNGNAA